jgi:hypothetical protein
MPAPDRNHIEDWLRIHRELMEREAAFTDLALRAADGSVSIQKLEEERQMLMGLRALCTSVYGKAFPKPQTADRSFN